MNLYPDLLHKN